MMWTVARPKTKRGRRRLIVVGVDGSVHSRRALEWALAEARVRGDRCLVVHALDYGHADAAPLVGFLDAMTAAAREVLDTEVAFARHSRHKVKGLLISGPAAGALLGASRDADLLVLGSRGKSGLSAALGGSVSTAVLHQASCPVVVVPSKDEAGTP